MKPPAPIWSDDTSGLAVYVNGGFIQITGDCANVTPAEAAPLPAEFAQAITEACSWASRWDPATRTYRDVEQQGAQHD